jgi:uncharacterized membrane protein YcaP (DUF421 family)
LITRQDLLEQLREQGVESPETVRKCFLESDGRLSVIREDESEPHEPMSKRDRHA